jgi:hypothetical protein
MALAFDDNLCEGASQSPGFVEMCGLGKAGTCIFRILQRDPVEMERVLRPICDVSL